MDVTHNIRSWIERLSVKHDTLGGHSICPFAKKADYEIITTDGSTIDPPPWDFELIIYVLPNSYSIQELTDIANAYNNLYPEMVFLPDHKDRATFINGVQSNNGKCNLILCQWRDNLENARTKLSKTTYYSFWDKEYLDEILGS